jgi:hypothetical protein
MEVSDTQLNAVAESSAIIEKDWFLGYCIM